MAHPEQAMFIQNAKNFLGPFFRQTKVIELGSLDINGSVRQFFEDCDYVGLDIGVGKGVDVVGYAQDFGQKAKYYDVVISCEMMEHNSEWDYSFINMVRIMKSDGLLIMSCAAPGRKQHGTKKSMPYSSPLTVSNGSDYYYNLSEKDFRAILPLDYWFSVCGFFEDRSCHDLYFIGLGKDASDGLKSSVRVFLEKIGAYYESKNRTGDY